MEPNIMMLHKCLNPSIGDAVVLRHGGTFAPSPPTPPPPPPHTHTHTTPGAGADPGGCWHGG
jgi:hypothetical protein